jgi:hypothetical protein
MGAGARLAEERDRWPDHWRVADLEQEEERLLDLLDPTEELLAAVPGRTSETEGQDQVLIGVTDRRVLVIGRRRAADSSWTLGVADATMCAAKVDRSAALPYRGGRLELDLDEDAMRRLWSTVDGLLPVEGFGGH